MANTRTSSKRARQNVKHYERNKIIRTSTKTAIKDMLELVGSKEADLKKVQETFLGAIKALGKAASKGAIPKKRASRKISRITALLKKLKPEALAVAKTA